ncbi:peptidase C19, ubiquitin carboxyl-terminal hydrolase 2 [Suillus bovinus]|uniref:peptidase C19, ubiquitin carboxyl-terminal hydrolase 2 n=1 Tax=Suillus bovinus TaxID=48563 RepID=UPI001B8834FF|nr:peptidase C19, ubiquitin carboxyl-terminal hydrolase 2 [Suillus bovinus]KAG2137438.1 peptidase C19, ubiquitin carboxyl-terminal hydrolase 2 [Suillus bovinus]
MAKQKSLTPQEIYRARKAREEREKNALLPPGLLNHGNTCFMNSVLQGLIATQHLSRLVLFQDIPPAVQLSASIPVASHRSPELTNGHGLAGHYEQPWTPGLPIGDLFVTLLRQAWAMQDDRQRNYLKPKELLASVGQKYDQYLDFRQQDAHEFLRHLLDAMQMEEVDIIKKRRPSIKHKKKKYSSAKAHASLKTDTPERVHIGQSPLGQIASAPDADPSPPEEETLAPFVDMLFGGRLASILVCQACKHVSHTYEDFNDLSLSIKAEDYARERKRDKLKQLAKKLRNISGTALSVIPVQRSSSVPATPHRDSMENTEVVDPHRRRSIDLADVEVAAVVDKHTDHEPNNEITIATGLSLSQPELHIEHQPDTALHHPPEFDNSPAVTPDLRSDGAPEAEAPPKGREHIEISEPSLGNGREKREKSESWSKLGRRISVSVGLTKQSREDRRRSKEQKKARNDASHQRNAKDDELYPPSPYLRATVPTVQPIDSPDVNAEREPTSLRSWSPVQKSSPSPSFSSAPRFPLSPRQPAHSITSKRSKVPRPPKLSAEEAAYLRDILADVSPGGAASPFSIFKQTKDQSSTGPSTVQNMFLKIPQLGGLEDCLRLFTSVEVLDGENMVKCHRCWKIANGVYEPRSRGQNQESDSCTDSDAENESSDDENQPIHTRHPNGNHTPMLNTSDLPRLSTSPSSSATSLYDTPNSHDTLRSSSGDATLDTSNGSHSLKSLPLSLELSNDDHLPSTSTPRPATYGGLPIPSISTTAPESPMSIKTARPSTTRSPTDTSQASSLHAHTSKHDKEKHPANATESEDCSDEESGVSANLSAYSDFSSTAVSPAVSPNVSQENLTVSPTPRVPLQPLSKVPDSTGVPPSKKVIMRAAYKRYLIATPPPVLVIHLKRFQQMSKVPIMSFSSSFKKLEDYVSFPEYLDIAPYLAPKREEYADAKPGHVRGRSKRSERCMYRLYAVVVHMGNMLGGHYISYTALPSATKDDKQSTLSGTESEGLTHTDRPHRDWAYISDTTVRLSSLDEVLKSKAYICMYERI